MTGPNMRFCQYLIAGARQWAKQHGVKVPKRITALRSDMNWFFVEADGVKGEYITADNAFDARAKFIYAFVDRAVAREDKL